MNLEGAKHFVLKIVLADHVAYNGTALSVKFQALSGEMMMFADHENYITALAGGVIQYETMQGMQELPVTGGVCKFQDNVCDIAVFA